MCKSILFLMSFVAAVANAENTLSLGVGPSVPKNINALSLPSFVFRNVGGEHFIIDFKTPKYISSIKIIGYSASRTGKVLIRDVKAVDNTQTKIVLEGLFDFSKVSRGDRAENFQNLVMLPDLASVEVEPKRALKSLDFTVEGYVNNDSSMLIQITSDDDLSTKEFMATRSGPSNYESVGEYFDEANYARFTGPQLQILMKTGVNPKITDLAGKSFVCSAYAKNSKSNIDAKTRQYFYGNPPSILQSVTDLSGTPTTWILSQQGWIVTSKYESNCNPINQTLFLRMTQSGALISEWNIVLNDFVNACAGKFDPAYVRNYMIENTYTSVVDPKYITDSYEYCRPVIPPVSVQ